MRITNGMMAQITNGNLGGSLERIARLQAQATSGKRINRASDDPAGTSRVMTLKSSLASAEQYQKNVDFAQAQLQTTDKVLGNVSNVLQEAKRIALSGSNDGTSADQRKTLATQVDKQIDFLVSELNSQTMNRYAFSGGKTQTPPVAANPAGSPPYVYEGDDSVQRVPINDATEATAGLTAKEVLNLGGEADPSLPDTLTLLTDLKKNLLSDDPKAIQAQLAQIDGAFQNAVALRGRIGTQASQLELYSQRMEDAKGTMEDWISQTEGADIVDTLTRLQMEQNVYQASLLATSKLTMPTLADYMR